MASQTRYFTLIDREPFSIWLESQCSQGKLQTSAGASLKKVSSNDSFDPENDVESADDRCEDPPTLSNRGVSAKSEASVQKENYQHGTFEPSLSSVDPDVKSPMETLSIKQLHDEQVLDEKKISSQYFSGNSTFQVSLKHRREQYRVEMEDKLFSSLRYQIKLQVQGFKDAAAEDALNGSLKARLVVCESSSNDPLSDQEGSLDGSLCGEFRLHENETTKVLACNLLLHIRSQLSFHFTRKDYKIAVLICTQDNQVQAALISPLFRLFARKPNKKQYSRIKKRKMKEQLDARKRMKLTIDASSSNDVYAFQRQDISEFTNEIHMKAGNFASPHVPSIAEDFRFPASMGSMMPSLSKQTSSLPPLPNPLHSSLPTSIPSILSTPIPSPLSRSFPTPTGLNAHPQILSANLAPGITSNLSTSMNSKLAATHGTSSMIPAFSELGGNVQSDLIISNSPLSIYNSNDSNMHLQQNSSDSMLTMSALEKCLYPQQALRPFNYNYNSDLRHYNSQRIKSPQVSSLDSSTVPTENTLQNHQLHVYPCAQEHPTMDTDNRSSMDPMLSIYQNPFAYNYLLQQQILCNPTASQQILCSPTSYRYSEIPADYQPYLVSSQFPSQVVHFES